MYSDLLQRLGSSSNYRSTLKSKGWPTVGEMRGKIIVVLTGGYALDVNDHMEKAMLKRGGLLSSFLCPNIDAKDASEFSGTIDSISYSNSAKFFCGNVEAGDHYHITANRASDYNQLMHLWHKAGDFGNMDYPATYIAVAHGVSIIGWDIEKTWQTPSWTRSSIPLVGVRRSLPGYMKIRPIIVTSKCLEVEKSKYSNGSDLNQSYCDNYSN